MRTQRLDRVTCLGLLALAHPVNLAQWAQHAASVLDAIAVQYASRTRAGRYGVGRCERVGGGRHVELENAGRACLDTLEWRHSPTCLPGGRQGRGRVIGDGVHARRRVRRL